MKKSSDFLPNFSHTLLQANWHSKKTNFHFLTYMGSTQQSFVLNQKAIKLKKHTIQLKILLFMLLTIISVYISVIMDSVYSPIAPHAFGEDIDVPFMSWEPLNVQFGTDAIAPPGALMLTPNEPSVLREKNVTRINRILCC